MTGSIATVYEITGPAEQQKPDPLIPIKVWGEGYLLRQPKLSITIGLTTLIEGGELDPSKHPADVGARLIQLMWSLVQYVEDEPEKAEPLPEGLIATRDKDDRIAGLSLGDGTVVHNRARLIRRLNDPKDRLDILDLAPLFQRIAQGMFDRPTGPSPESRPKPGDGGPDSAAASPEPQAATSGP